MEIFQLKAAGSISSFCKSFHYSSPPSYLPFHSFLLPFSFFYLFILYLSVYIPLYIQPVMCVAYMCMCVFREMCVLAYICLCMYVGTYIYGASQVTLMVKNQPANAGDVRDRFDPWVRKISWRRAWQPI